MSASSSAMSTRRGAGASVMTHIVAPLWSRGELGVNSACREGWLHASIKVVARALVSQLAEETDSKPVQCEFESHRGHHQEAVGENPVHSQRSSVMSSTRRQLSVPSKWHMALWPHRHIGDRSPPDRRRSADQTLMRHLDTPSRPGRVFTPGSRRTACGSNVRPPPEVWVATAQSGLRTSTIAVRDRRSAQPFGVMTARPFILPSCSRS